MTTDWLASRTCSRAAMPPLATTPVRKLLARGDPARVTQLVRPGFFDVVTVDTGWTRWLTGEFGASLAAALALTGWLFWRQRQRVESRCAVGTPAVPLPAAAAAR